MWICIKCGFRIEEDDLAFCGQCGASKDIGNGTAFDVILVGNDPAKKINVIKTVREITGCGLKDAKDFVEITPQIIGIGLSAQNADMLIAKLQNEGGICEKCSQNTRAIPRPVPVQPVQNINVLSDIPASDANIQKTGCASSIIVVIALFSLLIFLTNMLNL